MRFKLTLYVNKQAFGNELPLRHQYEQSAAIYRILSKADSSYSEWLHSNGYTLESGKRFKLFTFSRFEVSRFHIDKSTARFKILTDTVIWYISFLPEHGTENFIQGLFMDQSFEIGDKISTVQFQVAHIEMLPTPNFSDEMIFNALSPICVKQKQEDGRVKYLELNDTCVNGILINSLLAKYHSFYGKPYVGGIFLELTPLDKLYHSTVTIKANTPQQTKVKGYCCKFRMKAPVELMKVAYESGLGEECSQGFGCIGVIE